MKYYRQGDIAIIPIAAGPTPDRGAMTAVKRDAGRIVLAYGEVTGHAHAIHDTDVELFAPGEASVLAERYLRVGEGGATVSHEEHGPIALEQGWYEVRHQREYSPAEIRRVAD